MKFFIHLFFFDNHYRFFNVIANSPLPGKLIKKLNMKKYYLILLFSFCICLYGANAQTSVILPASQDNTIHSNLIYNSNGAGDNFTSGTIINGSIRRALLRFDLSVIPAGATITAATLGLVMNKTVSAAIDISLYKLNASWGEGASQAVGADGQGVAALAGDATWVCSFANGAGGCSSSWITPGGVFTASPSATTSVTDVGAYSWSSTQMTNDLQGWVNNAATNYGWIIRSDEIILQSAKRFSSRTNPIITERPTLSVTYTTVTPVTLLGFKAAALKTGVLLNWETGQEIDNDFFEIEHSSDAVNFNVVAKIKGAGNSNIPIKYRYIHQPPTGYKHFYRISQTDFNGRKSFSKIASVAYTRYNNPLLILPNPVNDRLVVAGLDIDGTQRYALYNYTGHKIASAILLSKLIVLPQKMPAGIYHLRIMGSDGRMRSAAFIK